MPRLLGYPSQRRPFNVFDAFSPQRLHGGVDTRLFSDRSSVFSNGSNIGHRHLTNICVPGALVARQETALIGNWYARTNVSSWGLGHSALASGEFKRAWDAWTHVTTVTMVMGAMQQRLLPMADLLGRAEHQRWGQPPQAMQEHMGPSYPFMESAAADLHEMHAGGQTDTWSELPTTERERWLRIAEKAWGVFGCQTPTICPVRQTMFVSIETESRALGALLEVMPTDVAPQALVWVHIEGLAWQDRC